MQVKLFWVNAPMQDIGFNWVGSNAGKATDFEQRINQWLSDNPDVEIHHIKQSASGGGWKPAMWFVSVWYENARS